MTFNRKNNLQKVFEVFFGFFEQKFLKYCLLFDAHFSIFMRIKDKTGDGKGLRNSSRRTREIRAQKFFHYLLISNVDFFKFMELFELFQYKFRLKK